MLTRVFLCQCNSNNYNAQEKSSLKSLEGTLKKIASLGIVPQSIFTSNNSMALKTAEVCNDFFEGSADLQIENTLEYSMPEIDEKSITEFDQTRFVKDILPAVEQTSIMCVSDQSVIGSNMDELVRLHIVPNFSSAVVVQFDDVEAEFFQSPCGIKLVNSDLISPII